MNSREVVRANIRYGKTFYCTAICNNTSCPKMLTKALVQALNDKGEYIRHGDLSLECEDYIEVLSMTEMEAGV